MTQQDREKTLVAEFLECRGIPYKALRALSEFCPDANKRGFTGPDVEVVNEQGNACVRIEVLEYTEDKGKGSRDRALKDFWYKAWQRLQEELNQSEDIRDIMGTIRFISTFKGCRDVDAFVAELVRLTRCHASLKQGELFLSQQIGPSPFAGFPLLQAHVKFILLHRDAGSKAPTWQCDLGAFVGADPGRIGKIIAEKNVKAVKYAIQDGQELWLLIAAGVSVPSDSVGSRDLAEAKLAADPDLQKALANARFDHVYLWNRCYQWWSQLK